MLITKSLIIASALAIIPLQQVAHSQQLCAPQEKMEEFLITEGQLPLLSGLVPANMGGQPFEGLYQIFVNPETREFTEILTRPSDKSTCIMKAGKHFEIAPKRDIPETDLGKEY
jgi:hypothetical protein